MPELILFINDSCHACRIVEQEIAFLGCGEMLEKRNIKKDLDLFRGISGGADLESVPCLLTRTEAGEKYLYGSDRIISHLRDVFLD